MHHDPVYILCNQGNEMMEHLFFLCLYSDVVWQNILKKVNYDRTRLGWSQEIEITINWDKSNSVVHQLCRMTLTFTNYIWKERNMRKFQKYLTDVLSLIRRI